MAAIPPTSVKYFWGRLSREEAEQKLANYHRQDGLFLLRESTSTQGNYALSICLDKVIHHYNIERQPDNMVMIQDGKKFAGPIELITHHQKYLDGFLVNPTKPCERGDAPCMAFKGVTMLELDNILFERVNQMNLTGDRLELALGAQRPKLIKDIVKNLHEEQPWYHGNISRDEADGKLQKSGHSDGKFLVRSRDDKVSFALSISYRGSTKHYKIDYQPRQSNRVYAIEDGPQFESIMQLVDHYYCKTDGLLCKLQSPCVHQTYQKKVRNLTHTLRGNDNSAYGVRPFSLPPNSPENGDAMDMYIETGDTTLTRRHPQNPLPPPPGAGAGAVAGAVASTLLPSSITSRHLPPPPGLLPTNGNVRISQSPIDSRPPALIPMETEHDEGVYGSVNVQNQTWDEPIDLPDAAANLFLTSDTREEDLQKIYDSVPRNDNTFNLRNNQLELGDELGAGCFGSVMQGICRQDGQEIPVAVKTLKSTEVEANDSEIMKEAKLMSQLDNRHIVRMIGMCKGPPIMLVLELAPLGPLNKALKKKNHLHLSNIYRIMHQVADGMAYLESIKFVHRDLAARNVLLVNKNFAKISDFGMSKALGIGNNYYMAKEAGKWPLKWYAPESIYYWKFDSKSDVWSYGVTLWEAMSFGAKPYRGLKGQEILQLIESGKRLDKPLSCPTSVYEIMLRCWEYKKKKRPNFQDLTLSMERVVAVKC